MMILAGSAVMPSLKFNNSKKKVQKKASLHQGKVSASLGKCDYRKEMASVLPKAEENLKVSNGHVHLKRVLGDEEKQVMVPAVLGKRKASRDAEVALQLHYKEGQGGTPQGKQEMKKLGYENSHGGSISSKNGSGGGCVGSDIVPVGKVEKYSNGNMNKRQDQEKMEPKHEVIDLVSPPPPKKLKPSSLNGKAEDKPMTCLNAKQPALVLKNIKKGAKKMDRVSNVIPSDNYVRRMASLNASACVTALMEPERKNFSKAIRNPEASLKTFSRQSISKSPSSSESEKEEMFTFGEKATQVVAYRQSPTPSSCSSMSSSDSQSLGYNSSDLESPQVVGTILALLAQESPSDDDIPYNRLGLLYNGDTLHPSARVFYTSDTDLTLPHRIIPRVFPSRDVFVSAATRQALPFKSAGKKKKAAKGNNGWMTLGEPVKVIEYRMDGQNIVRKFYAGIRRNGVKEIICVRDNIVVRAGGEERGDKPYVAKISSIWRETAGQLMMTVFWYYRPDELDGATIQSNSFQKDELLASQHHDDNSVACIEDKCHILGVSQYCRYNAYMKARMSGCVWKSGVMIPPVPCRPGGSINDSTGQTQNRHSDSYHQFFFQPTVGTNSFSKMVAQGAYNFTEPDVQVFPSMESGLVFLCYRGYNHCVGKLSSRSFK